MDEKVKQALGGGHHGEHEPETETHELHYKRADNGGFHVHVSKRAKATHEHHHSETHVLPDIEAAKEHLEQHMGDQPPAGEAEPDDEEAQANNQAPDGAQAAPMGGM